MREPASLGVIGAGVAGCALAAQLRRLGWRGWIGLWEAGRGPGGRAASRRSRHTSDLALDHGAPLFNITETPAPALLGPLRAGGWIEPWLGEHADLDAEGHLHKPSRDPLLVGELWRGCGGMDRVAHGLLELAEEHGAVERHWGHRVRRLEPGSGGGWRLFDSEGEELAEVAWLVLSGSLLAHPRATALLGWQEVPLQTVATGSPDQALRAAVASIAGIHWEARSNLLLTIPSAWAAPWRELPFRLLACDGSAQQRWPLRRLVVQPQTDGCCTLVAHSSAAFAARHHGIFGSSSSLTRELGRSPDAAAEAGVLAELGEALTSLLAPWIPAELCAAALASAPARLMRWGAAFPESPGLEPGLSLCPASQIGFCGDYLAGPGFGRIEGALRSAESLAEQLVAASG